MRKTSGWAVVASCALAVTVGLASWGPNGRAGAQEGIATRAAEKIDEVGRKVVQGIDRAEDAVRGGVRKTREQVQGIGIVQRVYGRLHWDKTLFNCTLNIKADGGTVTLRGVVPSQDAKTKAATLAAETVGVNRVIDELLVPDTEATGTAATARPVRAKRAQKQP